MKVKTIDFRKEGTLLPPAPSVCQECAREHDPALPHDAQTLYFQTAFFKKNGRWPTWKDAMAHCTEDVQKIWLKEFKEMGVDVDAGRISP